MSSIDLYDTDERYHADRKRFHADRAKRERNLKKKEKESQKDNTEPDPVETFKWTRNKESGRLEKYDVLNDTPQQPVSHPVGWCSKNHYMDLGWGWCGQSCPCCRAMVGDTLGACGICIASR